MKRNYNTLWLLLGTALLPVVAAVGLYYSGAASALHSAGNRGELLTPVMPMQEWGGDASRHTGKWTMLLSISGSCQSDCRSDQTEALKSVHDALGRNATRVRIDTLQSDTSGLNPGVWLVDPNGNLVMHFASGEPGDVLHDLRRLLRLSSIG